MHLRDGMQSKEKTRWIWIRGLARSSQHWGDFKNVFLSRHPDAEIEFIDLPGNGVHYLETSPLSIPDYVKFVREKSQFVREKKPFHILAMSLGAMVAVSWAQKYPDEIKQLFLVTTSSRAHCSFYERLRWGVWPSLFRLPFIKNSLTRESLVLSLVSNKKENIQKYATSFAKYSEQHPISLRNFVHQILAASSFKFPDAPPVPCHLIGTKGDRFVNCSCTLNLARDWKIPAAIHPTAGHDLPLDEPEWLSQQIID